MMNWAELWIRWFGTMEWLGLDIGFWTSMGTVTLLVVLMNVVFWGMRPLAVEPGAIEYVEDED